MSALISKSLRSEVLTSAKEKRAGAVETLVKMYSEHAKAAAKRAKRPWTEEMDKRIRTQVEKQLAL
ncbi:hypothetical protein [Rhizobium sp. GCM10022189]|uniref:hypothetical protein n=1 Tax=Rhizobium sp. GCM10022189 TaxID=3252654 RepID=UPI00361EE1F0